MLLPPGILGGDRLTLFVAISKDRFSINIRCYSIYLSQSEKTFWNILFKKIRLWILSNCKRECSLKHRGTTHNRIYHLFSWPKFFYLVEKKNLYPGPKSIGCVSPSGKQPVSDEAPYFVRTSVDFVKSKLHHLSEDWFFPTVASFAG